MQTADHESARAGLVGREQELSAINRLLGRGNGGADRASTLLLRGSAGVGKTSLLDAARTRAEAIGFRVLRTAGSEAETSFAFAALHPLLLPVIAHDADLPEHLRTALRSALGQRDDEIPALEIVALATLGLWAGVASNSTPLCVIVDDVHWLDASTAGVLRFVARRLSADPIVVVAAGREGGWIPPGVLPEMPVEPLEPDAAEAILRTHAPQLTASVRSRVMAEAQGNPLALVELPRALEAALRDPSRSLPPLLPLTARLEAAFTRRMDLLPDDAQAVLLAAALAPAAGLPELMTAAAAIAGHPVGLSALHHAVLSDLVDVDSRRLHFRHPLMRSGLLHATPLSRRQAAHQALAEALTDPERCLYHRAEAHVGYDDTLADELEEAAARALRRGAQASAVSTLEQAAALTRPGPRQAGRLVRAARLSFELGRSDEARLLLDQASGVDLERADQAMAQLVAAAISGSDSDDPGPAWELIASAHDALAAGDDNDALRLLEFAATRVIWGAPGKDIGRAIVAAARQHPAYDTDPRITALLANSMPIEGHRELAARLTAVNERALTDSESQRLVGSAAAIAGDYERASRLLDRAERQLRKEARLALLATVLTIHGVAAVGSGQWLLAEEVLDEAERLAGETNQAAWLNRARQVRAGLAGMCGDLELHRQIVDEQTTTYQRTQALHRNNHLNVMRGKTAAMAGRFDDALTIMSALFDPTDPIFDARAAFEILYYLADAASAKERPDVLRHAIEVMGATVPAPWPSILQSGIDYARAVAPGDPQVKQQLFETALTGPARSRPFDLARIQLAYGVWLRRQSRRLEARERLRGARSTFDQLGNEPYARRARDELRATGEASASRRNADWEKLSPQELQIARLVAEGLSNKQIGERLFLSHRTIGSHLYRTFPKLGVTSRSALAAAIRSL